MQETSLKFGTSGLRGLAAELNGPPSYAYARAFIEVLLERGEVAAGGEVALGEDLRSSSPEISALCAAAIADSGLFPVRCGALPTPALSLYATANGIPAIMVTGSHIPDDRNGLKFYRATGEIDKADEAAISARHAQLPRTLDPAPSRETTVHGGALDAYIARYLDALPLDALKGLRIGIYQHSSVARDTLAKLLTGLGADIIALGRSEVFVPVDTEALRPEDVAMLQQWAKDHDVAAIVSTDGDADRPLIADEAGRFVRGDLVGAITGAWLNASSIVVPVTANSALEASGRFETVLRTKVGSPYVIEGMQRARRDDLGCVVGFEANGGVLLGSDVVLGRGVLSALPTRDAALPILACLASVAESGRPLSAIAADFGFRTALSDRLQGIAPNVSSEFLQLLLNQNELPEAGRIAKVDRTDGVRLTLESGAIVHYRASGNAPELRCYVESDQEPAAWGLLATGIEFAQRETGVIERKWRSFQ